MDLQRTPLYNEHCALNARMVDFGGWEMPVQYADGIVAEYTATRQKTAVFDICHMGEFMISGSLEETGLDFLVTQPLKDLSIGACRYGMTLNAEGGVIDDLIVFRLEDKEWMVVVNAATKDKDLAHFKKNCVNEHSITDVSDTMAKIDVQGPGSRDLLREIIEDIDKLDYYTCGRFDVLGQSVIVSRTGYTGELGFELYCSSEAVVDLWREVIRLGAVPAGLGARDVLRMEMGYPLYGHELSEELNPLEAGMNRFVDWEKNFFGKEALKKRKDEGLNQKLVCCLSDSRRSPRSGHNVFCGDNVVGHVASGTFSPYFKQGIALAFLDTDYAQPETAIAFGEDTARFTGHVVARPIYKQSSLKA